jgi:hypothetical protein
MKTKTRETNKLADKDLDVSYFEDHGRQHSGDRLHGQEVAQGAREEVAVCGASGVFAVCKTRRARFNTERFSAATRKGG